MAQRNKAYQGSDTQTITVSRIHSYSFIAGLDLFVGFDDNEENLKYHRQIYLPCVILENLERRGSKT